MAAEAAAPVLRIQGATRRYRGAVALDGVDLEIRPGEVYALTGRNGAGKSTLAKAAIGALALDSGSIWVRGEDPSTHAAARRRIGIAPQDIALWGHLTIEENVDAFAALAGVAPHRRAGAVDAAMASAFCRERRSQKVSALSGGWRRRANLAAAIVHGPELLVLDEPTEGLDARMKSSLHTLVHQLRTDGVAILLISHDNETVAALANRIGILVAGRLVVEGAPQDLEARAFTGRQQLTVRILGDDEPRPAGVLRAAGLTLDASGAWGGLTDNGMVRAEEIEHDLKAVQAVITEMRVSRPGIDALIDWATHQAES